LNEVRPPPSTGKERRAKQSWSTKRIIGLVVRLAILLVVLMLVALVLQVPLVSGVKWTDRDSIGIDRKRLELERMIQQKRACAITLSEAEINSYVGQIPSGLAGHDLVVEPTTVRVELGQGDVTVIVIGKIKFGKSFEKLTGFRYTGVPTIKGDRFVFEPVSGEIGRLPIHPKILHYTSLLSRYYAQLFRGMSGDRELLGGVSTISVDPKRGVELKYNPVTRR